MSYKVKSPILFLIFNRPKEAKLVFKAIKEVKPAKLYVAADGPRESKNGEAVLCAQSRDIIKEVDWECEVKTLFREDNLGCKIAVSSAITWFFENEPEGIVLEDDCLPSTDFFKFMDEMLVYYRDNPKIAHICGCNFQDGIKRNGFSYYYSNITHVWGWAGWRRVWDKYDVNLSSLDDALEKDFLSELTDSERNKRFLSSCYLEVKKGNIDTWDFQYSFTNIYNKMHAVIPNSNMISNIGFNKAGTHTVKDSVQANLPFEKLEFPLKHPEVIAVSKEADEYTLKKEVPGLLASIINSLKGFAKKIIYAFYK